MGGVAAAVDWFLVVPSVHKGVHLRLRSHVILQYTIMNSSVMTGKLANYMAAMEGRHLIICDCDQFVGLSHECAFAQRLSVANCSLGLPPWCHLGPLFAVEQDGSVPVVLFLGGTLCQGPSGKQLTGMHSCCGMLLCGNAERKVCGDHGAVQDNDTFLAGMQLLDCIAGQIYIMYTLVASSPLEFFIYEPCQCCAGEACIPCF